MASRMGSMVKTVCWWKHQRRNGLITGVTKTKNTCVWAHQVRHHALRWRHNEHDSVSNHQPHDCLLNRLFRRSSEKTSKLRVTGLCAGNSPGTGEFSAQMASNAENVSIWWRHHGRGISINLRLNKRLSKQSWGWWFETPSRSLWRHSNDIGRCKISTKFKADGWCISCKIVLLWLRLNRTDDNSTSVQVMAWCRQVTSHYVSQCWPSSMSPYGVTRPQCVDAYRTELILENIKMCFYSLSCPQHGDCTGCWNAISWNFKTKTHVFSMNQTTGAVNLAEQWAMTSAAMVLI